MRRSTALWLTSAVCLTAAGLFASPVRSVQREVAEVPAGGPEAILLGKALRAIALPDGSRLLLHLEAGTLEKNAVGATRITPDGRRKTFWAENFFREAPESGQGPAARTVGQIYGAAMLPDRDTLAMSIGWVDARGKGHNAVGFWSLSRGAQKVVEFDGTVRDLAAIGEGLVVAVSHVPSRGSSRTGWPLLTLLDTEGLVHGEFFSLPGEADMRTIGEAVTNARIERLADKRAALYFDRDQTVSQVDFSGPAEASARASRGSALNVLKARYEIPPDTKASIGRPVSLADQDQPGSRVLGFRVEPDGSVTAVKTVGGARPRTTVRTYRSGDAVVEVWSTSAPWRLAYWNDAAVVGLAAQQDLMVLESVTLKVDSR